MSTVLTKSDARVREAWEMIERAEPGDSLSVGVALDYVMDATGCDRERAKTLLYRHVGRILTGLGHFDYRNAIVTTYLSVQLFDGNIWNAKLYMQGYGVNHGAWDAGFAAKAKRLVKLCSWVESTE